MKRYRIGLTVGTMNSDYPHSVRMGIQNTIEEAGHVLVAVSDLLPRKNLPNDISYYRMAFQIAARLDLDAVIVPVGSVVAHLKGDSEAAFALLKSMNPATTLLMEREVEGFRSVMKDNRPGMRECMRHLIETCGLTRIAFVSGPESSQGARERESVYFEEMAAHGIDTPPSLFARGVFSGDCAEAIERVIDENPDLEAIACACDLIAYTAYDVLHRRGVDVGEGIAVTGFDDHVRSAHLDPPLSTVHMTGYDYGCMAAREAIRLCAGLPQEEFAMESRFVPRSSCGEGVRGSIDRLRDLFRKTPLPSGELVSIMVDSTLYMAGPSVTRDFSAKMTSFLEKVYATYQLHLEHPSEEVLLFSSQDLSALFEQDYREHLSLEGFHTMAITMLEALMEESSDEDVNWVIEQIAHLHLRIARLLNNAAHTTAIDRSRSEWLTFHMVDDALREDGDPATAYRLMLSELGELGVREASLYLLSEPVEFVGVGGFGLSDLVRPVGRLSHGSVSVDAEAPFVALQSVLDHALGGFETVGAVCSVGGVVAGNEMVGLLVIDPSGLDESRQLMVFLNLGLAIKHLQMIADEREMNELLNRNNLLLEQQSQHDELTGLLNRRGYLNRIGHLLRERQGDDGAILFLDLDGLKTINDTYGHDMGDEAIRSTARLLADRMPKDGLLARLGGDEFVAFVPGCSPEEVAQLCGSVQEDMGAFNARGDAPFTLGISCGVACFSVDEKTHARLSQLMGQADAQLYQMKRAHKLSRRYVQES